MTVQQPDPAPIADVTVVQALAMLAPFDALLRAAYVRGDDEERARLLNAFPHLTDTF